VDESTELATNVRSVAHSLVPVTNNSLGNQSSEVVVILPADTLHGNSNVGSRDGIITDSNLRADEVRLSLLGRSDGRGSAGRRLCWEAREVLLSKLNELLVGNATRTDQDHSIGSVVGLDVVDQVVSLDALDVLGRTQDCTSQRLSLESGRMKVVEHNLLQLLVNLLGFSQDHVTLALDRLGLEFRVLEDIGEDVDSRRNIRVEGLGVVHGVLTLSMDQ